MDWGILERSIGPRVRLLRNALHAGSLSTSEQFGLPTGSLTVMALVAANPGSSQAELAAMAGITGPSLVGILDDLEQRNLLGRTRDVTDRRRNVLALTPEGTATMTTMFEAVSPIEAPLLEALGEIGRAHV